VAGWGEEEAIYEIPWFQSVYQGPEMVPRTTTPDEKGFWGRDAQTSVIDDVVIWGIGEADLAVKEHGNHEKMHEMNLLHSS